MATPPTFVSEYETVWNDNTSKTVMSAVAVNTNDVIITLFGKEASNGTDQTSFSENGAGTFNVLQTVLDAAGAFARAWGYVVPSGETLTVSCDDSQGVWFGLNGLRFSGSDGIGASASARDTSGDNTISITTTQDNSSVVVLAVDYSAADGSSRTWATVNSYTPTAGNGGEKTYYRDSAHYTVYAAVYPDVGAAGAKTVGLTAPDSTNISLIAVEVKGAAGGPSISFGTSARLPATATTTNANPATFTINCPADTGVLWLGIVVGGTTARAGGDPTYNSVGMTAGNAKANAGGTPETNCETWYMINPPTGSAYTISVPNSGSLNMTLMAATATKVNASGYTMQRVGGVSTPGNSTNPSTTGPGSGQVGDITFARIGDGATSWNPSGRSGTQIYDWDAGSWGGGAQYKIETGTGGSTQSWTFGTSEDWIIQADRFQLVTAAYQESLSFGATLSHAQTPAASALAARTEGVTVGQSPAPLVSAQPVVSFNVALTQAQEGGAAYTEEVTFTVALSQTAEAGASAVAILTLPVGLAAGHEALTSVLPSLTFPVTLTHAQAAAVAAGATLGLNVTLGYSAEGVQVSLYVESLEFGVALGAAAVATVSAGTALAFPITATFLPVPIAQVGGSITFAVTLAHAQGFQRTADDIITYHTTLGHVIAPLVTARPTLGFPVSLGYTPLHGQNIIESLTFTAHLGMEVSYPWMPEVGQNVTWTKEAGSEGAWVTKTKANAVWSGAAAGGTTWVKKSSTDKEWH